MILLKKIYNKIHRFAAQRKIDRMFAALPRQAEANRTHMHSAIDWLCNAQDTAGTGGVPAAYFILEKRWGNEYRETTGYITATFLAYAKYSGDEEYFKRAVKMGNWETGVQSDDGSFGEVLPDGSIGKKIFNTGQVILGLCALYDETGEDKWLASAIRAADWLAKHQEEDGSWINYTTAGARTYHTRDAWALLEVWKRTREEKYHAAAKKQLDWSLGQQHENGWFAQTSLTDERHPWTHLIGYTISGLVESAQLMGAEGEIYFSAALHALRQITKVPTKAGLLPTTLDENWHSHDADSCLTGDAQIAFYLMKAGLMTGDTGMQERAAQMLEALKRVHILAHEQKEIAGGIMGSYPVGGSYCPYSLINWGAKFFIDLLLLDETKDTTITS